MLIKKEKLSDIKENEITDESVYKQRREFIKKTGILAAISVVPALMVSSCADAAPEQATLTFKKTSHGKDLKPTAIKHVTTYNNFYEFGTSKSSPAIAAQSLKIEPWSITVEGDVKNPGKYNLEDILKKNPLEERIYRFRCVEAWSMVIPWVGFPLADFIKQLEPGSKAKYIEFQTLHDPEQMPGQKSSVLQWPYTEGLRIDEAMHPLVMMATGVFGKSIPKQNGAPIRLVVPWKYGFKNIKSIVKMRFVEQQPKSSWELAAPLEYGFYANVNPKVDHPRWTQSRERIIGSFRRRKTDMFNGYADEVASLYTGVDLKKFF